MLKRGDIIGRNASGRVVTGLVVDRGTSERFMAFGAELAEAEDNGDAEPDWLTAA